MTSRGRQKGDLGGLQLMEELLKCVQIYLLINRYSQFLQQRPNISPMFPATDFSKKKGFFFIIIL